MTFSMSAEKWLLTMTTAPHWRFVKDVDKIFEFKSCGLHFLKMDLTLITLK